MDVSNQFILTVILFIIYGSHLIENKPNQNFSGLSLLCYENVERLVRTPFGFRCVTTKRSTGKRSAQYSEQSALESDISDNKVLSTKKPITPKEDDLNLVTPKVEALPVNAKYKRILIKNNRGPWKIANQIFKRSPNGTAQVANSQVELLAEYQLSKSDERDGLLVNKHLANDSDDGQQQPLSVDFGEKIEPKAEQHFSILSDTSVERKFIRNLPKINLFSKPMDKKNLRNFRFTSDIDVLDLMEDDSVLNTERTSQSLDAKDMTNLLASDRRSVRSPLHLAGSSAEIQRSDDKSVERFTPIKIFVFLNRNQKTKDWTTDASIRRYNIAERPRTTAANEMMAESVSSLRSTSTTTTTTTTTPIPIKRVLKNLDLNEFNDKYNSELFSEDDEEEDRYSTTISPLDDVTIGEISTSAPVSRHWGFKCGKRKGFYADVDNDCRTYYQCSVRGRQRWECPPGTRFNQHSSTCDWMENVNCLEFRELNKDKPTDPTTEASPTSAPTISTISAYEPDFDYDDSNDE